VSSRVVLILYSILAGPASWRSGKVTSSSIVEVPGDIDHDDVSLPLQQEESSHQKR